MQTYVCSKENIANVIFGIIFKLVCKYGTKYGICDACYRFPLEQTYVCIIFALCKFDVNPFF